MNESRKDRLKNLAESEQYISGIYNYCDRWCERCTMRSKCLSFAIDPDLRMEDSPRNDLNNEKFWQGIHESFELTFELLRESAEERGFDLNFVPDPDYERRERIRERRIISDPLLKTTMAYAHAVDAWMDERKALFGETATRMDRAIEMDLPGHDPLPIAIALHEAVEMIRWYQFFLYPKITRAISGMEEGEYDRMDDVLGSARIALIAIEHSIGAW
ncbi:MAG: hypothetical protein PHP44_12790 [Kiritimatiellae bacterium]|nr:hypothetical protein [Kiritimatiellia bacterium]